MISLLKDHEDPKEKEKVSIIIDYKLFSYFLRSRKKRKNAMQYNLQLSIPD